MKTASSQQSPQSHLDFCLRLAGAHSVMVRRLDNALGTLHGISFSDFQLLFHLNRAPAGRLRRVDLAERQSLSASGVTRSLIPLEKIGLVTRQTDSRDARVGYAVITAAGNALLLNALETAQMVANEFLGGIDLEQLDAHANFLGQLAGIRTPQA